MINLLAMYLLILRMPGMFRTMSPLLESVHSVCLLLSLLMDQIITLHGLFSLIYIHVLALALALLKNVVCAKTSKNIYSLPLFLVTHHSKGERVTGLRHRQALDHLWCHPGKCAHQRHVCCVGQEPGCPKITDLK